MVYISKVLYCMWFWPIGSTHTPPPIFKPRLSFVTDFDNSPLLHTKSEVFTVQNNTKFHLKIPNNVKIRSFNFYCKKSHKFRFENHTLTNSTLTSENFKIAHENIIKSGSFQPSKRCQFFNRISKSGFSSSAVGSENPASTWRISGGILYTLQESTPPGPVQEGG